MRNSPVEHCHAGRAYLEVVSVGAGESLLWKQAIYADGKKRHMREGEGGGSTVGN